MAGSTLTTVEQQLELLITEIARLRSDLDLVKNYVAAKLAKKERRKQKKRQQRLAEERARRAEIKRNNYEKVVSEFRSRPWRLLEIPDGILSPREEETLALLARGISNEAIAKQMGLKPDSIPPRLCVARKKLGVPDNDGLVEFYRSYKTERERQRNAKLWAVIGLLLKPPRGLPWQRDYPFRFERHLGRSRNLDYRISGVFVPDSAFDRITPHLHNVMLLKSQGLSDAEVAEKLRIKVSTIPGYISTVRSHIRWACGSWIKSEALMFALYAKYAKLKKKKLVLWH
jgi:DNA-binding NarL/FixJ family response regulator